MKSKFCIKCKEEKSLDSFYVNKTYKDGVSSSCKNCHNKSIQEYRQKYPWKKIYGDINQRCENPKNPRYHRYGGRGIRCMMIENEVKELWFRDKAYLMNKPSIDRKDNDGNYEFDNCQFIEFGKNSAKDKEKPVNQYDLNGNLIATWKSAREIEEVLGFANSNISKTLCEKTPTAYGFIWIFKHKY